MTNAIHVISPYLYNGVLVFDDPDKDLIREAFVAGADIILIALAKAANVDYRNGFNVIFSAQPFVGNTSSFTWVREEYGGNWYRHDQSQLEGWLCPALFKYFDSAPKRIYITIKEKID